MFRLIQSYATKMRSDASFRKKNSSKIFPINTLRTLSFSVVLAIIVVICPSSFSFTTHNLSTFQTPSRYQDLFRTHSAPTIKFTKLSAVTKIQTVIIDGSELSSLQRFKDKNSDNGYENKSLQTPSSLNSNDPVGFYAVAVGSLQDSPGSRIIGVVSPDGDTEHEILSLSPQINIYSSSLATIPSSVTDTDAISTLINSMVGVHCSFVSRLEAVGGSEDVFDIDTSETPQKVVVVGSSDLACFIADSLATLGASVNQISTSPLVTIRKNRGKAALSINISKPAVGKMQLGFAAVLGKFDTLVDCLTDEVKIDNSLEQFGTGPSDATSDASTVIRELKLQHGCHCYVSTLSASQKIVRDEGLLFGRNKSEKYVNEIVEVTKSFTSFQTTIKLNKREYQYISPPPRFGPTTLQTLLNSDVLFSSKKIADIMVRQWSLKDFLELTTWPRDSIGGQRFGFPNIDDLEVLDEQEELDFIDDEFDGLVSVSDETKNGKEATAKVVKLEVENPFITKIQGVEGLEKEIVSCEKDCILFLSAKFCRTCKGIVPQYTRLARINNEEKDLNIMFAQADLGGKIGKQLGRALDVEAVPTFVMFRKGELYGDPLSISRLPSKKLNIAVEYLSSGTKWDRRNFRKAVES